jgi:threonine synthase
LLDIAYDWASLPIPKSLAPFTARRGSKGHHHEARSNGSGVWRFRELLPPFSPDQCVTLGEGRTHLQRADELAAHLGADPGRLFLQYEGFNPSGSFKDNGMAVAFTVARRLGRRRVACASTGNTSASLALYAALTRTSAGEPLRGIVLVGGGKIAFGKLAQALDHGALTLQVAGDFDACMRLVQGAADRLGLYLVNSVNPFRLEGQKCIMYRVLEGLDGEVPDWIIVPGGNLGNASAFGKAFLELRELGLVRTLPRLAVINAAGANTLHVLYNQRGLRWNGGHVNHEAIRAHDAELTLQGRVARTVASAIEIARPVNLPKALRSLDALNGVVREVSDEAILDGKALVGRFGFGCEPAGGATIAGWRLLRDEGVISKSDRAVCILTGHALKDPRVTIDYHAPTAPNAKPAALANAPRQVPADLDAIAAILNAT